MIETYTLSVEEKQRRKEIKNNIVIGDDNNVVYSNEMYGVYSGSPLSTLNGKPISKNYLQTCIIS